MPLSYRSQSIHLLCKSIDWFLYDNGLRHERVNDNVDKKQRISILDISRSSHQRCSVEKGVLRNFAKFRGKHLCQSGLQL